MHSSPISQNSLSSQHSSPVVHSGKPNTREFVSTSCQSCSYFSFFLYGSYCLHLQLGCACTILSRLPAVYFIALQLLLGYKACLLFFKDIWTSFVMCLLGKPETSSMPILYEVCYFKSQSHEGHALMFVMAAEYLASSCLSRKCLKFCKLICATWIIWTFTTSLEMSCGQVSTCSFYHYLFLINFIH